MSRKSAKGAGQTTRDAILTAAIARFSKASYDETGLRDIAADVGVDVAYVHRSFGSKEALFAAALQATADDGVIDRMLSDDPLSKVIGELFAKARERPEDAADSLNIIMRSMSSQKAAAIVSNKVQEDLVAGLTRKLEPSGELKASMIVAVLLGMGIARNILKLRAFQEASDASIELLVEQILEAVIKSDA